jgi:hypothetical protein
MNKLCVGRLNATVPFGKRVEQGECFLTYKLEDQNIK